MLRHRTSQYLLAAGFALHAGACKVDSSDDLLEKQQQRWRANRPQRYVAQICEKPFDDTCRRIAVEGDAVVAAQTGSHRTRWDSVDDVSTWQEPMDELFDAAREPREECILKQLEFEATFGFVGEYMYQCRRSEDDHGEEVVCFVDGADSLEACEGAAPRQR